MSSVTTASETAASPASSRRAAGGESQLGPVLRRLLRQPGVVVGAVILLTLIVGAVFAPFLTPYEPAKISPREALQAPSLAHPLGTDHFGRDQLARLMYGGSLSLQVGLVAVAIGASIGVTLGAVAGYRGGWIDEIIGRIIDVKLAFPGILLALGVVAVLGPDLMNLMIAVGVGTIPGFCRLVRGQVLAAREFDYVLAARTIGCQHARIVVRHILPNVIAPVVVYGTLAVAGAILAGASLNYLGMGAKPPTPEWGLMLAESRDQIRRAWWLATFPGAAIMLTVISINLLGDGLRDAFDPWLKGR
jgi:peptide/nickel transport system permease protein